jgi:hypothetical protein
MKTQQTMTGGRTVSEEISEPCQLNDVVCRQNRAN